MSETTPSFVAQRLAWRDTSLGVITLANGNRMRLTLGLGSGLSQRPGDPKGTVWAIADRGPNLKIKPAIKRYGLEHFGAHKLRDYSPLFALTRLERLFLVSVPLTSLSAFQSRPLKSVRLIRGRVTHVDVSAPFVFLQNSTQRPLGADGPVKLFPVRL
jgi:hypothetical protein